MIEQLTSSLYIQEEIDIYRYGLTFDRFREEALDLAESLELIAQAAEACACDLGVSVSSYAQEAREYS